MIGILCPSEFEFKALDHAKLKSDRCSLVLSGMGKLRALYACAELKRSNPSLKAIVLIGFAGGLTPNLSVGDVVEPDLFIEQDYFAEPFEKFPNQIVRQGPRRLRHSVDAVMLTQDRFLTSNPYAGQTVPYQRIACDMESYAVAFYCAKAGLLCAAAKIISDSADEKADHDFLKACRELSPKLNSVTLELINSLL